MIVDNIIYHWTNNIIMIKGKKRIEHYKTQGKDMSMDELIVIYGMKDLASFCVWKSRNKTKLNGALTNNKPSIVEPQVETPPIIKPKAPTKPKPKPVIKPKPKPPITTIAPPVKAPTVRSGLCMPTITEVLDHIEKQFDKDSKNGALDTVLERFMKNRHPEGKRTGRDQYLLAPVFKAIEELIKVKDQ